MSAPISGNQFHDLFMCRGKVREAVTIETSSFITISRFWNPSHTGHMLTRKEKENAQKGQLIFIQASSIAKPERMKSMHHSSFNCQAHAHSRELDSVPLDSVIRYSIWSLNEKN